MATLPAPDSSIDLSTVTVGPTRGAQEHRRWDRLVVTAERVPNLASRVLGLSLRRLSADIQAVHGYPVLLAETFVDPARFAGTCYRASNWRSLGMRRGFARDPGAASRWRHHGQPKVVFVFELTDSAAEALS